VAANDGNDRSDELLSNIRKITRAISMHSKTLLKTYGLTGPQLVILTEISRSTRPSVTEIARRVSLSQATVTNIVGRLEQQGFLERERGEADRRKVYLRITDKTQRTLDSHPSLLQVDFVRRFNDLEDWEQSLLLSSVQRIAAMMGAQDIEAGPFLYGEPLHGPEKERPPE
jgi:DNA-binding MarR family transcriptional regulator